MNKYFIGYKFDNGNIIIDGPTKIIQPAGGYDYLWLIKCPCGNKRWTYVNSVRKSVYPCKKCYDKSLRINSEMPAIKKAFRSLKGNAKSRNIKVCISIEEFYQIASKNCNWCNKPPTEKTGIKEWQKKAVIHGIDRIDSLYDYTIDNCVSSCYDCNRMKSNLSKNDFLNHVNKIYEWSIINAK